MVRSMLPWKERLPRPFGRLEEEFESLMNRFFRAEEFGLPMEGFTPEVNVVESDGELEVTVDLPGIEPKDVDVELRDGNLWISGKKKEEKEEKGKTYHRVERRYGEFRRVIPLPTTVDEEKIEAEYHEGVLKITVPKTESAKPKRIEVTT